MVYLGACLRIAAGVGGWGHVLVAINDHRLSTLGTCVQGHSGSRSGFPLILLDGG